MSFESSSLSSLKSTLASSLTASECKVKTRMLEDSCDSFGRQLPVLASTESEVLGCDDFAVSRNFFQCGPFIRGDSSLRLVSCRDFPLLCREISGAMSFESSSLSSSKWTLDSSLTASEYKVKTRRLEDSRDTFGRQFPVLASTESEVLGCDDFAVSRNFFQCGPFIRGDSSLRLDSCRDIPLLCREISEMLVAGIRTADVCGGTRSADVCALLGKYAANLLFDASVESSCKTISFCLFYIIRMQAEGKLTCPLNQAARA